jgi:hypothetical protein
MLRDGWDRIVQLTYTIHVIRACRIAFRLAGQHEALATCRGCSDPACQPLLAMVRHRVYRKWSGENLGNSGSWSHEDGDASTEAREGATTHHIVLVKEP